MPDWTITAQRHTPSRICPIVIALAIQACAQTPEGAALPAADGSDAASAAADAALFDGSLPTDAGTTRPVLPEASVPASCVPGAYTGMFNCNVNGLPIWGGAMAFTLESMAEGAGEFRTLQVVAGTRLKGSDSYGGSIDAELVGDFDCNTGMLNGAIQHGTYTGFWGSGVSIQGPLMGNYQATTPPSFAGDMGPLSPDNPDALSPMAVCTWTAQLTP